MIIEHYLKNFKFVIKYKLFVLIINDVILLFNVLYNFLMKIFIWYLNYWIYTGYNCLFLNFCDSTNYSIIQTLHLAVWVQNLSSIPLWCFPIELHDLIWFSHLYNNEYQHIANLLKRYKRFSSSKIFYVVLFSPGLLLIYLFI